MNQECHIRLRGVDLEYELHFDRTNTLKERVINLLLRRKYVEKKKGLLFALKGLDLDISHGERLGVIGLNGAGKSTLLKVLAKLLQPTRGTVEVVGNVQPLIEIGAGFDPEFSGRENIFFNGAMLGFSRAEMKAKEEEIVAFAELGEFIDVPVKYYSSGMVVRLAFTIATIVKPEILLLDEMLSAGDIEFVEKAQARIRRLLDDSKILVLVSHDLGLVKQLATRVIVLDAGRIVFDGTPDEGLAYYYQQSERHRQEKNS
jgi:ABC-type polysaccharide/polyol phosphate transport system ATPase subunit